MSYSQLRVRELIQDIRTRWRRRAMLQGTAVTVGALAGWGLGLLVLRRVVDLAPIVLLALAVAGGLLVLGLGIQFIVRPGLRRIPDEQIALLIEERVPELQDRLNSAVEIDDPDSARRAHGILVDRLIDDAAERARSVPLTTVVDRHRERMLAGASAIALALFLVMGYSAIDDVRLTIGGGGLSELMPERRPFMTIDPGNVEIEQGGSQDVVVSLREDTDRDVVINFRNAEGNWQREVMQPAIGRPEYLHEFVSVQQPLEYFVQHDEQRSDVFNVSLYTFPSVSSIDLTYVYPQYTGLSPETQEGTGDIFGLRGSDVSIDVSTAGNPVEGELVRNDGLRIPLERTDAGRFRASMTLDYEGLYHIRLIDEQGKENKFPDEYQVIPVDDQRPRITITDPQRDVRANAIEEVLMAVRVEDDFGIEDVRLQFAVNAGEEQTVALKDEEDERAREVEGEHLFFLEDYTLEPGDVISYFVEADDAFHESPEMSDMYFIEVIPFDQEYRQVTAGGMQGGGGQSAIVLNQQQIIAATWRLVRERDRMDAEEFASSRRALVQAQESLRGNIQERISSTAFSVELQMDDDSRRVVDLLRSAVEAMSGAVIELNADRLREALTPEREALNALLKADALNREQNVALNRDNQGGGGGGGATEERMTELMDLELDISKDKYEVLPERSGPSAGSGGEMDEALQRLRELSRRQQNLANQGSRDLEGDDQRRQVERLSRDQEELRREAQQLARQMSGMPSRNGQSGEQAQEQLERITRNMQEAQEALQDGDVDQARARQQQAVNELERMTRDMRVATNDGRREALQEMDREFEGMREQEEMLARDLERAAREAQEQGGLDAEALEEMAERRRSSREALERFREQVERVAEENADTPEIASAARNLRQGLRREALEEQMDDSERAIARGWLDNAQRRQESIRRGMERLEQEMRAFEGQLPVTNEERLARSMQSLRELERELERLRDEQVGPSGGDQRAGEPGQGAARAEGQGEPSDGQSGDQPASSGEASSGQGGGDRAARADAASRQARLDRAREQIRSMQEDLGEDLSGTPAGGALDNLSRGVSRADNPNVTLEGEAARAFFDQEIFAPLSQLEEELLRELDRISMEKKLHGSRPGNVPPEYRELVEKYYESLSKSAGP